MWAVLGICWQRCNRPAADADPTSFPCWHTQNQPVRGDTVGDYRTGSYHSECPNRQAGTKHGRCTNAGPTLDAGPSQPAGFSGIAVRHFCRCRHAGAARIAVVDEDRAGTNEHIVLDRDPIPYQNTVFDGDAITDYRSGFNKRVVTNVALATHSGTLHHMREGPYPSSNTDVVAFTQCQVMDEDFGIRHLMRTLAELFCRLRVAASRIRTTSSPFIPSEIGRRPLRMHSRK